MIRVMCAAVLSLLATAVLYGKVDAEAPPEVRYDVNFNGYVERDELIAAVADYFGDRLSIENMVELISLYLSEELIPPPSLRDLVESAPWYQDGLDYEDVYQLERRAYRSFGRIDANHPMLARMLSQWSWAFDDEITANEIHIIDWMPTFGRDAPREFIPRIGGISWVPDGVDRWEYQVVAILMFLAMQGHMKLAEELLASDWIVDDMTKMESLVLSEIDTIYRREPELAWQMLGEVHRPIRDIDYYILKALTIMERDYPDQWARLRQEPWLLDGLSPSERAYLTATASSRGELLYEPYEMASSTVVLLLRGEINLWAVRHGEFHPDEDIITKMEAAVRGAEEFMGVPFPVDDVILYVMDPGFRGRHLGRLMLLDTEISFRTMYHETAHYYYHAGPSWYTEGGANMIMLYVLNDGEIPPVEFSQDCADDGFVNLQAHEEGVKGATLRDPCAYAMGTHFLYTMREAMGEDAWLNAQRAFHAKYGLSEQYFVFTPYSPGPEDVYRVFMEHTPKNVYEEVNELWRSLHGGPFIDGDAGSAPSSS